MSARSELTIVQLTDTHLRPAGELLRGAVDTHANLTRVLTLLREAGRPIDALVLSGDLTDDGSPEAYRRLREAVEPVAAELDAQIVYAMGNHDERVAFAVELLDREPGTVDPDQPHDQRTEIDGLRVITLDSTTPHRHDGYLEPEQLVWLAAQLREPAPRGTLLILHHPPLPSSVPATDLLKLDNADELAAVVAGTDVRMILCGHNHLTAAAALAGIPVWIGPALAYRLDPMAPVGRQRGFFGFGYSRVDLVGETILATAIEATPAEAVYDRAEDEILDQIVAHVAQAR
ncbi:metallophosphoesterase [Nocardia mangyaensis]|uniref:metallophosphoesterase n=1 Tax=Nocardia mangyaensis TaxID=2213200 RepID=UPI002675BBEF|nr:metallophosphoesterase [Nocardia mangyaensis]MDO3648426.1 metallophosphoesterase [Nocardia mangyaensis]